MRGERISVTGDRARDNSDRAFFLNNEMVKSGCNWWC